MAGERASETVSIVSYHFLDYSINLVSCLEGTMLNVYMGRYFL